MNKRGFTLLEIIIVIAIIGVTGFGFMSFVRYEDTLRRNKQTYSIQQSLRRAQSLAQSNELPQACANPANPTPDIDWFYGYGIRFNASQNTLSMIAYCVNPTNNPNAPTAQPTQTLVDFNKSGIRITITMSPTEYVFNKYSGKMECGSCTHRDIVVTTNSNSDQSVIRVYETGQIETEN